jgi:hypothetical protein
VQNRKFLLTLIVLCFVYSYSISHALSGALTADVPTDSGGEGAFINVTAKGHDVLINSFETTLVGTANIRVYYRTGSSIGFENDSSAWTLLGSETISGGNGAIQTLYPIHVGGIVIPAGQTYGFLIYSGFGGSTELAIRTQKGSGEGSFSDNYIRVSSDSSSFGGDRFSPFDGANTIRAWRGVVHYETISNSEESRYEFQDGRINRYDVDAPYILYPQQDEDGATGLVVYDSNYSLLLAVSASEIAAVEEYPNSDTLIAQSDDGRVGLYRLTNGALEARGTTASGKTYILTFDEIAATVEYSSYEQ